MLTPFLNPDPFQNWYGVKNVAKVKINRESCMALLNNGMQINTIMPSYVKSHSLESGPITNLIGRWVTCIGMRNAYTWPLSYIIIKVQVDGVQGYNEDQIALVVPDLSNFVVRIPIILGTPTISHIINVMKEREIDALVTLWANARVANLLSVQRAAATAEDDQATEESSLGEYDEVVVAKNTETVDAFSSHVIPVKAEKAYTVEPLTSWPKHYKPETALYLRVSPCKMCTPSWGKVARTQSWWWGIPRPTSKLSRRKPQWPELWPQLQCQNNWLRPGCWRG